MQHLFTTCDEAHSSTIPQAVAPPPPVTAQPVSIVKEREVVTREVVMIPCAYCGNLMPQTSIFCPNCGAKRRT